MLCDLPSFPIEPKHDAVIDVGQDRHFLKDSALQAHFVPVFASIAYSVAISSGALRAIDAVTPF
jgi:hypothetical protein